MIERINPQAAEQPDAKAGLCRPLFTLLGALSLLLGIASTGWLVLMAGQWALPWSSLAVMAPPPENAPMVKK